MKDFMRVVASFSVLNGLGQGLIRGVISAVIVAEDVQLLPIFTIAITAGQYISQSVCDRWMSYFRANKNFVKWLSLSIHVILTLNLFTMRFNSYGVILYIALSLFVGISEKPTQYFYEEKFREYCTGRRLNEFLTKYSIKVDRLYVNSQVVGAVLAYLIMESVTKDIAITSLIMARAGLDIIAMHRLYISYRYL